MDMVIALGILVSVMDSMKFQNDKMCGVRILLYAQYFQFSPLAVTLVAMTGNCHSVKANCCMVVEHGALCARVVRVSDFFLKSDS